MDYEQLKEVLSQAKRIVCRENGEEVLLVFYDSYLYCSDPVKAGLSKRHIREVKRIKQSSGKVEVFW